MRSKICLSFIAIALLGAAPASAADCPGADLPAGSSDRVGLRAAVVCLTNAERAEAGLVALVPEGRLEAAAQSYSELLVRERFFSHVTPGGSVLSDRLSGYTGWRLIGENLAWGEGSRGTPRAIVAGWMASPGHRKNILNGRFTEVGIGVVSGTPRGSGQGSATYTAEYGTRASDAPRVSVEGSKTASKSTKVASKRSTAKRARKAARRCRKGTVRRRTHSRGRTVTRCVSRSSRARV